MSSAVPGSVQISTDATVRAASGDRIALRVLLTHRPHGLTIERDEVEQPHVWHAIQRVAQRPPQVAVPLERAAVPPADRNEQFNWGEIRCRVDDELHDRLIVDALTRDLLHHTVLGSRRLREDPQPSVLAWFVA